MKNMIIRALRTFFQAALGFAAAHAIGLVNAGEELTKDALATLTVAAISAGVAAVMNLPHKKQTEEVEEEGLSPAEERAKANELEEDNGETV